LIDLIEGDRSVLSYSDFGIKLTYQIGTQMMQEVSLTPKASRFLSAIMARGYENAAQVVELALKQMAEKTTMKMAIHEWR
jgi:hypothetical protein